MAKAETEWAADNRPFEGFTPQLFEFFEALAANQNREWFQANKARHDAARANTSVVHAIQLSFDGVALSRKAVPAGVAGVALLPRARVQRDGIQAALLRKPREWNADDVVIVPAQPELNREGNGHRAAHSFEERRFGSPEL